MTTLIRVAAILVTLLVAFLTLGPVGIRSLSPVDPAYDRALAFGLIGFLGTLSAPRRPWLALLLVIGVIVGLELSQYLFPGRHGRLIDGVEKLVGALIGAACAVVILRFTRRRASNEAE